MSFRKNYFKHCESRRHSHSIGRTSRAVTARFLRRQHRPQHALHLLFYIFWAIHFDLSAQEQDLKFEHFTIEDGLSHSKVNSIFQDDRGFLWFGTNDGLNKFDGYEFTVYRWKPNDPKGLSAQLVRVVFQDRKRNLWVGTEGGGVNLFNRDTDSFRHFSQDSTSEIKISGQDVNSIYEDHHGNLWLGTSTGLELLDSQNKKAFNYFPESLLNAHPRTRIVNVVYEDKKIICGWER